MTLESATAGWEPPPRVETHVRVSFQAPSDGELAHDYLWRVHARCPPRGHLGVFNRSHYEDVLAARLGGAVDHDQCRLRYPHLREPSGCSTRRERPS